LKTKTDRDFAVDLDKFNSFILFRNILLWHGSYRPWYKWKYLAHKNLQTNTKLSHLFFV